MEILLVIYKFFARGGAQRDLIRTAQALQKRSCRVTLLCALAADPPPEGCQLHILPAKGCSNHARMKSFESAVGQYLSSHPGCVALGFSRIGGLDMLFAADDCLRTLWKNPLLNRLLPRKKRFLELEKSALDTPLILTLTARQERDYKFYYPAMQGRFKRLPPGIDCKYRQADYSGITREKLRQKLNVPADRFLIVQAAASFRTKGVDRSIAVINGLPDDLKNQITLIVAGDDRRRERYAKLAEMLKLDLRFPGGCDNLEELYCAADLMLHPARSESAGSVLIEALCCDLPILTTNRCGYAEYVTSSGGGVVLPEPFNQEHWVLALTRLMREKAHLMQCRKNIDQLGRNDFWYSRAEVIADEVINFARAKGVE